jgi:hypothetical protein
MSHSALGENVPEVEDSAWRSVTSGTTYFLGNFKGDDYESRVEELLRAFKVKRCKTSL